MSAAIERTEREIMLASENLNKLIEQRASVEKRIVDKRQKYNDLVDAALGFALSKIYAISKEKIRISEELKDSIEKLDDKIADRTLKSVFEEGEPKELKDLKIERSNTKRKLTQYSNWLNTMKSVFDEKIRDKNNDEKIAWMQNIGTMIPEILEEVMKCHRAETEINRLATDCEQLNTQISNTENEQRQAESKRYPNEVVEMVRLAGEIVEGYSTLEIYNSVFSKTIEPFLQKNKMARKPGIRRYDLYVRLWFSLKYFGEPKGRRSFICVDEGQDLSPNEFKLIFEMNGRNLVYNIFGDTNQLMKPGRGISDWSYLKKQYSAELFKLNENYRNTNQITRYCNDAFQMDVAQTGVDGVRVREIKKVDLEAFVSQENGSSDRIAILIPRRLAKDGYLDLSVIPEAVRSRIGDDIGTGRIAIKYVDEVKGIEFDKVYVDPESMSRNEKYIAYTRALSELSVIVNISREGA